MDAKSQCVEIQMSLIYQPFDLFVLPQNANKFITSHIHHFEIDKSDWCVAIKT